MPVARITAKWLQSVEAPTDKARVDYFDDKQAHFSVAVAKTGDKSFYWSGRVNGKRTRRLIASWPAIALERARELAQEMTLNAIKEAPLRAVDRTRDKTVGEVWDWYLEHVSKPNKRTWRDDVSCYKYLSNWSHRTLQEITRDQVIERRNELRKISKGSANAFVEILRALYMTAISNEWVTRNPTFKIAKESYESRERFLLPVEMPAFFKALDVLSPDRRELFLMMLFTGGRCTNVCEMRWDQLDLEAGRWRIPSERYKTKRVANIVLSKEAIEILSVRKTISVSEWVFPGATLDRPIQNVQRSWLKVTTELAKSGITNLHIHDLRRTLGSWQAKAGVPIETVAKSLGHEGTSATGIYHRLQMEEIASVVQAATSAMMKASRKKESKKSRK